MRSHLLALALLASMPIPAVAACHHYSQWNYPYPQKCGGAEDDAKPKSKNRTLAGNPVSASACTLYLLTPGAVIPVPQKSVEEATKQYWQYENYPDTDQGQVIFEALYCGKVLKLIEDASNTKGIPNFGPLDPGSVPQ